MTERRKRKTVTRNTAAKKLGVTSRHLEYWEQIGELKPERIQIGNFTAVVYTPELLKKAKEILFKGRRRKLERKREKEQQINEGRGK